MIQAKQLIKEYLNRGNNMPIGEMVLLTTLECEMLMEAYLLQFMDEARKENTPQSIEQEIIDAYYKEAKAFYKKKLTI